MNARRRASLGFAGAFGASVWLAGCTSAPSSEPSTYAARDTLMDPETCATCHPNQFAEWSTSMHAHASDDPLFVAMNARGQREAGIGDFCVKCARPSARGT